MNLHEPRSISPLVICRSFWKNRNLIYQMTRREIIGRYKGSIFGLTWSFFNPLLLLAIYTFVFSVVFKMRWDVISEQSKFDFALILFVGLIFHTFIADILTRAPTQISSNVNFVKKVIFPLEILTVINVLVALFHTIISFIVLIVVMTVLSKPPTLTAFLIPLTVLSIVPLILGLGWITSSLGVFVKDIPHFIGIIVTTLLFLCPIFYPLSALPEEFRRIIYLNPLTLPIEETRAILLHGQLPDWKSITIYFLVSLIICIIGFLFFQKTRNGFNDVL